MNYEHVIDYEDFEIVFKVTGFKPARPAPPCSNPDSPAFSDCGDDGESGDIEAYFRFDGVDIKCPIEFDYYMVERCLDEIEEKG